MNQIPAIPVNHIEGYNVSDDGEHMLLKTDLPSVLAFNEAILHSLLTSVVGAIGRSEKIKGIPKEQKRVFNVDWWEFGLSQDKEHLILSFRLGDGAQLSFRVHPDVATHMRDVLSSISGAQPMGQRPEGPVQ